jgi:hypothetical protein
VKYRVFSIIHSLSQRDIDSLKEKRSHDGTRVTYQKKRRIEEVEAETVEKAIQQVESSRQELPGFPGVYHRFVTVYGAREAVEGEHPEPDEKLTHEELLLPL